jgi:hypothetical protein
VRYLARFWTHRLGHTAQSVQPGQPYSTTLIPKPCTQHQPVRERELYSSRVEIIASLLQGGNTQCPYKGAGRSNSNITPVGIAFVCIQLCVVASHTSGTTFDSTALFYKPCTLEACHLANPSPSFRRTRKPVSSAVDHCPEHPCSVFPHRLTQYLGFQLGALQPARGLR